MTVATAFKYLRGQLFPVRQWQWHISTKASDVGRESGLSLVIQDIAHRSPSVVYLLPGIHQRGFSWLHPPMTSR